MDTIDKSGWTETQLQEFLAVERELAHEEERLLEIQEEKAAEAASFGSVLATKREALATKREARMKLEREAADDVAFADAVAKFGGPARVGRLRTVEGSFIFRPMTEAEIEVTSIKARKVEDDEQRKKVHKAAVLGTIVHPARDKVESVLRDHPGLWADIYRVRDALISGIEEEHAKKD